MAAKKICILGDNDVGKTALVQRFVYTIFSDQVLPAHGVTISQKKFSTAGKTFDLSLWDMEIKNNSLSSHVKYLQGSSGTVLVVDVSKKSSFTLALKLRTLILTLFDLKMPYIIALNKIDLYDNKWELTEEDLKMLELEKIPYLQVSAKTGKNVEEIFSKLLASDINK